VRICYSWHVLPLDSALEFDSESDGRFFSAIPARPGVFLLELQNPSGEPAEPYLGKTADLKRAAERLLKPPEEESRRLNLREVTVRMRFRATASRFEQSLVLYQNAREIFPLRYREHVRIRPPAVLKVNLRNEYPRCYVTRRVASDGGFYLGPFAGRKAAEGFAGEFLNFFGARRCQIRIRRDPTFPGCIYSEMKMCLAPCFAGCTKEAYDTEAERMVRSLATGGEWLVREFAREREAASEALEFERAAAAQKRLEKVKCVLRGLPEIARPLDQLDAVIFQIALEPNTVAVYGVRGGRIADPLMLRFTELSSSPRPVEEILREHLEPGGAAPESAEVAAPGGEAVPDYRSQFAMKGSAEALSDHLWLLARWFYSKPREGELFFREARWPYRRMARACSRLLSPAAPEAAAERNPPKGG
jgi:excinuclease ABC subunit C